MQHFTLSRGAYAPVFFGVGAGMLNIWEGNWNGKEIPALLRALQTGEGIRITRLNDNEMFPLHVLETKGMTPDVYNKMVCQRLIASF